MILNSLAFRARRASRHRLRSLRLTPLADERGSASIEFAGAMIVFALVFMLILQAGSLMSTQVTATNAAREVARAAVTIPPGDPQAALERAAPGLERQLDLSGSGDSVTASVRLKTPLIFSSLAHWDWWVHSSATMRRER